MNKIRTVTSAESRTEYYLKKYYYTQDNIKFDNEQDAIQHQDYLNNLESEKNKGIERCGYCFSILENINEELIGCPKCRTVIRKRKEIK